MRLHFSNLKKNRNLQPNNFNTKEIYLLRLITQHTPMERKKILVAEDIDSNFFLVKCILRDQYELIRAYDGEEAVQLFSEVKPDMVLMDIKMPRMNGIEATQKIRTICTETPIVALTANAFDSDKQLAKEAGCSDYLCKPLSSKQLREMLDKWI